MSLVNPLILKYNSLIFIICIFFFYLSLPSYINSKILKFLPLVSRIMNEEPVILEFLWPLITLPQQGREPLPPSYTKPPISRGTLALPKKHRILSFYKRKPCNNINSLYFLVFFLEFYSVILRSVKAKAHIK